MQILLSTPPSRAIGPANRQKRLLRRCGPDRKKGSSNRSWRKNRPGSIQGGYRDRPAEKRFASPRLLSAIKRHKSRYKRIPTGESFSANWRSLAVRMWKADKNIGEPRMRGGRKDACVAGPTRAGLPTWAFLLDRVAVYSTRNGHQR